MRFPFFSKALHYFYDLKKYQTIFGQFIIFACGAILTRGITVLFAPIAMQLLSPSEYGLISLANTFIQLLSAILGLGLRQAIPMFYFAYNRQEKHNFITDIILAYSIGALPIILICLYSWRTINSLMFLNGGSGLLIWISLGITSIFFVVELLYQLLRLEHRAKHLTLLQICVAITTVVGNLFFLSVMQLGACSLLLGQASGMMITCVAGLYIVLQNRQEISIDIKRMRRRMQIYIWYGLPFIPSMLFNMLLSGGDRWVLAYLKQMHDVGIYAVANTLAQLVNMIILYAMLGSYVPHMLKKMQGHKDDLADIEQENKKIMWLSMGIVFVLLIAGFTCTKSILHYIIPAKFHEAINYMGLLLIGSIFYLGTHFLNCLILHNKKSAFLGAVLLVPALLNIILNFAFVPFLNIYGCVIATIISYAIYFLITLLYNKQLTGTRSL